MTGYSTTPLNKKLGLKPGQIIAVYGCPMDYTEILGDLVDKIKLSNRSVKDLDFVHFFTETQKELKKKFPELKKKIKKEGTLWISWPKRSSKIPTDLDENIIREIGLAKGLVDVKVCAIDKDWSALKFVYRLKDR